MKARFLEDVEINDKKHGYKMVINKGDVLEVTEHENHYELRKKNGWGTMDPKECEGEIYEIIE